MFSPLGCRLVASALRIRLHHSGAALPGVPHLFALSVLWHDPEGILEPVDALLLQTHSQHADDLLFVISDYICIYDLCCAES